MKLSTALIPARGGSVGLKRKNVLPLGGMPLITWTISAAQQSGLFERIVVTTDCQEIARIARDAGAEVPFIRPAELASATATSADVAAHAMDAIEASGLFALLQPTSPFRSAEHLKAAARQFFSQDVDGLISTVAGKPLAWAYEALSDSQIVPAMDRETGITRRQDAKQIEYPNGAFYFGNVQRFMDTRSFIPERCASYLMNEIDSLDIDTAGDFELAEAIVLAGMRKVPS